MKVWSSEFSHHTPSLSFSLLIEFLWHQWDAFIWKNIMFWSPFFNHRAFDICLHRISSLSRQVCTSCHAYKRFSYQHRGYCACILLNFSLVLLYRVASNLMLVFTKAITSCIVWSSCEFSQESQIISWHFSFANPHVFKSEWSLSFFVVGMAFGIQLDWEVIKVCCRAVVYRGIGENRLPSWIFQISV